MQPFDADALVLLVDELVLLVGEIDRRKRAVATIEELLVRDELPQQVIDALPTWTAREREHLAQLKSACDRLFDGRIAAA